MADPVATQIVDFLAALLPPLAPGGEVLVEPPGDPAKFPALHLRDDGEDTLRQDSFHVRARLSVSITGFVRGNGEDAWRDARVLDAEVVKTVLADQQAGGLCSFIEVGGLVIETVDVAKFRTVSFRRLFFIEFSYLSSAPDQPAG